MAENQSATGLNRGLSSHFQCLRSANYVKLTELCMMCMEKHVLVQKILYKWAKFFKDHQNSIQYEGKLITVSPSEMVDLVKALILTDRRVTIKDISEQLGSSVSTAHKIMHDGLAFSKASCPKTLMS